MWLLRFLFLTGAFYVCCGLQLGDISCKDHDNNLVDWFYIYKLPKNKFSRNDLIKNGTAYLYITPKTVKSGWTLSDVGIDSRSSIPGLTLNNLYKNNSDLSLVYNDQADTKNRRRRGVKFQVVNADVHREDVNEAGKKKYIRGVGGGHTKGVILSDDQNGFWLVHSVPKYPSLPDKNSRYEYPDSAKRYGQSFLCISLSAAQLNVVGNQLQYNEPRILYSKISNNMKARFNNIDEVIRGKVVRKAPWFNLATLTSRYGMSFLSFAKSGKYQDDLYDGLVATNLKSNLLVESWRNGPGVLPSECNLKYKVNNIQKIAFQDKGIAFTTNQDHSKWAVTTANQCSNQFERWTCIGDINRAESQESRGGGTVCLQNTEIWSLYTDLVNAVEECGGKKSDRCFINFN